MSCSRTQQSDTGEARNCSPLGLESSTLPLSHCAPYKMLIIRAGTYKMLVRKANREDPDQTASEEAV